MSMPAVKSVGGNVRGHWMHSTICMPCTRDDVFVPFQKRLICTELLKTGGLSKKLFVTFACGGSSKNLSQATSGIQEIYAGEYFEY